MAPGYGKTKSLRSTNAPDLANTNPFYMTENDLVNELKRLESLLRSGELPADQGKRLQDVRQNLQKLSALKGDQSA